MKLNYLLCFPILVSLFCLSAIPSLFPNNPSIFGGSYATTDYTNNSSSLLPEDTHFISESNTSGSNTLPILSLEGINSNIFDRNQLDSENFTSSSNLDTSSNLSSPLPGTLQIPYTGLSTYHITPISSKLFGLNEGTYAMLITRVEPGSPAAKAGIRGGSVAKDVSGETIMVGGDIILELDSNSSLVRSSDAFTNYLQNEKRVGENITLTILRGGQTKDIETTIGTLPMFLEYQNKDEGIGMKFPSDWSVDESNLSKEDIVKFFAPENVRVDNRTLPAAGAFVKVAPTQGSLDDIASAQQEDTETTRVLDMSLTSLSNQPAYEIVFYDYSDEDRTLKILSVFTIRDGQIYRINFAADPPRYDDYLSLARGMVESFRFTK